MSKKIIGYCAYDKSEIYEDDPVKIVKGLMYHEENWKILQTEAELNEESEDL